MTVGRRQRAVSSQRERVSHVNRILVLVCLLPAILLPTGSEAQQPAKIPRIGLLIASSASSQEPRLRAFKQGLRELGYIEGQNITIEVRSGEGKPEQLPLVAGELVALNVQVIVSGGPASTRAAKQATNTIPIVTTLESDPVRDGLVVSIA